MRTIASLAATIYILIVALWFGLFLFVGDRTWWLVLLQPLVPWVFLLSLPPAIGLALIGRWRAARRGLLAVALLATWLWGGLFLPRSPIPAAEAASTARLRVMSFNALVLNRNSEAIVASIRSANPDVVAVQELSPAQAEAISAHLGDRYPYRALHPWSDPRGLGLWSRYPLTEIGTYDEGLWANWAQHVVVTTFGKRIHVFNAHAWPMALGDPEQIMTSTALRQKQTRQLAATLARIPPTEPFVVAADLNLVPLHRGYRPLAGVARDTWVEVGWGFGFTWPNRHSEASRWLPQPITQRLPLPPLVRIDYLWHSPSLRPLFIRVLPNTTGSDHYALLAEYLIH